MQLVSNLLDSFRNHQLARNLPFIAVILVVICAPFEKQQPFLVLPWQKLSNLEFLLLASLLLGGLCLVARGQPVRLTSALTLPAVVLIGMMLLSTLYAAYPDQALRACGRFVAGFLTCLLVLNAVDNRRRLIGLLASAVATGSVVALVAVLEFTEISWATSWIESFRQAPVLIGSELRVSSTLQYPTIASMYLEITFALALGPFLYFVRKRRRFMSLLILLLQLLILLGILLTLTRSGLIVVTSVLVWSGIVLILRTGRNRGLWAVTVLSLATVAVLLSAATIDYKIWLRIITSSPDNWHGVEYSVPSRLEFTAGDTHEVRLSLSNRGQIAWEHAGESPVQLAYHWRELPSEDMIVFEGLRTALPKRILPGESLTLTARVEAPHRSGTYHLVWDLVRENRIWFSTLGLPSPHSFVVVHGEGDNKTVADRVEVPGPRFDLNRLTLWRAAAEMLLKNPLLGVGPDNFRFLYGPHLGLKTWNRSLHTNNMYVEFLVSLGLIGGIAFFWFVWRILMIARTLTFNSNRQDLPIATALSGAILAFLVHGLTDYFLPFSPTYIMIWVCLGLSISFLNLIERS